MEYFEKYQNMIDDEVEGAIEYANLYCSMKDDKPSEADEIKNIAKQEIEHYKTLCEIAKSMTTPETEFAFNYLHKRNDKKIANAKMMLEM